MSEGLELNVLVVEEVAHLDFTLKLYIHELLLFGVIMPVAQPV